MFLFTEAHFWSSAKSCKRKLHSYSLVLLLLSHPSLHWSRAKIPSQRHLFYQMYRAGAEGAKKQHISSPQSHWGSSTCNWGRSLTSAYQQNRAAVKHPPGRKATLPPLRKEARPAYSCKQGCVDIILCTPQRATVCGGKAPVQLPAQAHTWHGEQKSQLWSQTGTQEPPSLPAADIQHNAKMMKHQAMPESQNLLWHSERSFTCTLGPVGSQPLRHPGILLAVKSFINLRLYLQVKSSICKKQIYLSAVSTSQVNIQYLWKRATIWRKYSMASSDFLYILYLIHYYQPTIYVWFWFSNEVSSHSCIWGDNFFWKLSFLSADN